MKALLSDDSKPEQPFKRWPIPPLEGREKAAALKAKKWMMDFLEIARKPEAEQVRKQTKMLGNQRLDKEFAALGELIDAASGIALLKAEIEHLRSQPDSLDFDPCFTPFFYERQELLSNWLVDVIQNNRVAALEGLGKILAARKKNAALNKKTGHFQVEQTLRKIILRALGAHIKAQGGPKGGFSHLVKMSWIRLSEMNRHSEIGWVTPEESLARWWRAKTTLHPRHLPDKKTLCEAVARLWGAEHDDANFERQFRRELKPLGLSGLAGSAIRKSVHRASTGH